MVKGAGTWYMPHHPNPALRQVVLRADAADDAGRKVKVPLGEYHRFENDDANVFRLDEQDYETEESFFRDFLGYINDCKKAEVQPSVFQLFLFLYAVGAPLAVPVPGPQWTKIAVSRAVNVLLGVVVGSWMLGYQKSYPE